MPELDALTDTDLLIARIDALAARLEPMAEHLARVDQMLSEYEPVIRAFLDPAASGPVAWAVRRKLR